jgi:predicted AAA+ superfamily ATPase
VRDVAQIEHVSQMPRLLRMLAQHSGQLINSSAIGAPLGVSHVTTQKYISVLEQMFLVKTLPPWFTNDIKRLVKTPKLHFLDSGLLASLRSLNAARLQRDRMAFGALLETFVLAELLKLAIWSSEPIEFLHFRDRDGNEVDIVMEDSHGNVVGIEVKASASIGPGDFSGLRKLADASGKRFTLGLVLYDHDVVLPLGERLFAVPIAALWK